MEYDVRFKLSRARAFPLTGPLFHFCPEPPKSPKIHQRRSPNQQKYINIDPQISKIPLTTTPVTPKSPKIHQHRFQLSKNAPTSTPKSPKIHQHRPPNQQKSINIDPQITKSPSTSTAKINKNP
jgi:hypothetical protein